MMLQPTNRKAYFMKSTLFVSTAALATLFSVQASAAVVAVMPVQGVNLTAGQCEAIGVLFTSAFARETNVSVAPPSETRPLLAQGRPAPAVAAQLGASEFIDLRAVQLENRVTVAGIRYGKDGNAAPSLDEMDAAASRLARSLAWRQPVAYGAYPAAMPSSPEAESLKASYPKAMGIKTAMIFPWSRNRTYEPMISLQFDGRIGSRDSFIEIGAGAAIPTSSSGESNAIEMGGIFAELGGSMFLSDGAVAPYLGGGVSPRITFISSGYNNGATCAVYGQAGVNFTRDSRARLYTEFRVSQYLLGIGSDGYYDYNSGTYSNSGDRIYPTEFSLEFGIGW